MSVDPETSGPLLGELSDVVRQRVLSLASDALPSVTNIPAPLRRVVLFAPQRRARLGGAAIAAAMADENFRAAVGVQVAAGAAPSGDDAAASAAWAWLTRPHDWQAAYDDALGRLIPTGTPDASAAETERLRQRVDALETQAREAKATHRQRLDDLRTENMTLRRKLGDTRASQRATEAALDEAREAVASAEGAASQVAARAETELRRLRAQIDELSAGARTERKEARAQRDDATLRARLLLDTVLDAASGLRRELALPPVDGAPGDRLEAEIEAAGAPLAARPGPPEGPALLEQLLSLPRARLIVDGYNVSKTAWERSSLEAQRVRLIGGLASVVARTGAETTVVFDAAASTTRPVVPTPRGVKVLFSPLGVIADDVIRDLVAVEPSGRPLVVVTSDQALGSDVAGGGARVISAASLVALLTP
ncbi:NYN domain-containing protein [Nocardioides sp. InS609-2]|uniref:NYN domain-containing protein n=1 Tax=Nocardioides sp. InS609-2 TaxID=2760705 RepID=UPI0020BFF05E|nr:NYN domain-containing protein [Nocardioides sp. InS609-2]